MYTAIFAIDPGKTTGIAWGLYRLRGKVRDTLQGVELFGHAQVQGQSPVDSSAQILRHLIDFKGQLMVKGHDTPGVPEMPLVVIEDFILRPQAATQDREMLSPVRLTGTIEGMLWSTFSGMGPKVEFQMPSEAKGFATNERLAAWEVNVTGRHAKDALRHIAVRIGKEIQMQTKLKKLAHKHNRG